MRLTRRGRGAPKVLPPGCGTAFDGLFPRPPGQGILPLSVCHPLVRLCKRANPRPTSTRHPWRGPGMPSRPYSNPYRVRPYSGLISGRKVWQATMHLAGRRQTNMAVLIPKGQAYAAAIGGAPDPPPTSRPKLRRPRAGSLQGSADDDHRHSVFSKMSRVHKEHSVMEKSIQSDQRYASKPRNSLSPPTSSPTVMKPRHRAAPGCSASGTGPPPPAASS